MFQPFRLKGLQQMSTKKLGCTEHLGAGLELQCCHPRGVDHPTSLHFCPTGWQQRNKKRLEPPARIRGDFEL